MAGSVISVEGHRLLLQRLRQAKTLRLKLSRGEPPLVLVTPFRYPVKKAEEFVRKNLDWIEQALEKQPPPVFLENGTCFSLFGEKTLIVHDPALRGKPQKEGETLRVGGLGTSCIPRRIAEFCRAELHGYVTEKASGYAEKIGKRITQITIRKTASRFGSCTSKGKLSFSLYLAFAPREIIDYVVAHEIAHLVHLNHSPAYRQTLATLYPSFKSAETWLRKNGGALLRIRI